MPHPQPRPTSFAVRVGRSKTGLGLYAVDDIPAKKFIIEYWGKVVSNEVAERVCGKYLFDLDNGRTILGATRKNVARYANHSCDPNSEVKQSGDRIYIYSLKRIKAGEEITYDYGEEYFDAFITKKNCLCQPCAKKRA